MPRIVEAGPKTTDPDDIRIKKYLRRISIEDLNDSVDNWDGWGNCTRVMIQTAHGASNLPIAMIEKGADPFIADSKGKNLLHLIVAKGHKLDDDVTASNYTYSVLGGGIDYENQLPLLEKLLSNPEIKQHINKQDINGYTPLHYAVARRDMSYIKLLMPHGADPTICDNKKRNAYDILAMNEQDRVNIIASAVESYFLESRNYGIRNTVKYTGVGTRFDLSSNESVSSNIRYYCGETLPEIFNQNYEPLLVKMKELDISKSSKSNDLESPYSPTNAPANNQNSHNLYSSNFNPERVGCTTKPTAVGSPEEVMLTHTSEKLSLQNSDKKDNSYIR